MTVKELKDILEWCNDSAVVFIGLEHGGKTTVNEKQVFHKNDEVVIDPFYTEEEDNEER